MPEKQVQYNFLLNSVDDTPDGLHESNDFKQENFLGIACCKLNRFVFISLFYFSMFAIAQHVINFHCV
jgi:hypothetical protein